MNTLLKTALVGALASQPAAWLMQPLLRSRSSIFMLHRFANPDLGVSGHDPDFIRDCLAELRRRKVRILSLDELIDRAIAGEPIRGAISFTMDDGFWDQGEIGANLFLEFDVPVTCFLISGLQDGDLWPWDDRLAFIYRETKLHRLVSEICGRRIDQQLIDPLHRAHALRQTRQILKGLAFADLEAAMTGLAEDADVSVPESPPRSHEPIGWGAARSLEKRGVRFGPHTKSHGIVSRMSDCEARSELLGAWDRLRAELVNPLDVYGWPTGRYSDFGPRDVEILQGAGFRAAVATEDDYATFPVDGCGDDMYGLRRFAMPSNLLDFIQYGSWIERGKQKLRSAFA